MSILGSLIWAARSAAICKCEVTNFFNTTGVVFKKTDKIHFETFYILENNDFLFKNSLYLKACPIILDPNVIFSIFSHITKIQKIWKDLTFFGMATVGISEWKKERKSILYHFQPIFTPSGVRLFFPYFLISKNSLYLKRFNFFESGKCFISEREGGVE